MTSWDTSIARIGRLLFLVVAALACASTPGERDAPEGSDVSCVPASERRGAEFGCFVVATPRLGTLGKGPVYWQLVRYPGRAEAEAGAAGTGTVVEAFEDVWVFTVGPAGAWPAGGERVAEIGPLVVRPGVAYAARYMEAVFPPGWRSRVHRHPGPEAWHTLSGAICLETPEGRRLGEAGGEPVVVPEGPPMRLTAVGPDIRRSLVIVLHDASQPASISVSDWEPKDLCDE